MLTFEATVETRTSLFAPLLGHCVITFWIMLSITFWKRRWRLENLNFSDRFLDTCWTTFGYHSGTDGPDVIFAAGLGMVFNAGLDVIFTTDVGVISTAGLV